MKLDRFTKAVFVGIALIAIVAYMDFKPYPQSFWGYSMLLGAVAAVMYYLFRRDKSEALAIFAAFYIMLIFGLEDLIFYIYDKTLCLADCVFPASMPHLYNHTIIGGVAKLLNLTTVSPTSLIISVAIGGLITYFLVKWLKKQKW